MKSKSNLRKPMGLVSGLTALATLLVAGCGGGGDGPAIEARPQTIGFGAVPTLNLSGTATASATASSGLAVNYGSTTPAICSVNSSTGVVTDLTVGTCIIAASQPGNARFAPAPQVTQSIPVAFDPNQTISFGAVPTLSLGGTATVLATTSSGLAVSYNSTTSTVCSVNSSTGLVADLTAGACTIAANQVGDANYVAAPQVFQTITVDVPPRTTVPGAPAGVTATLGNTPNTVTVALGATASGGSAITGYTVTSSPSGLAVTGAASPITVTCPFTCAGYAFSVIATNAVGHSVPSASADVLTSYSVKETFLEPDTQPRDSIFIGTFTLNSTTSAVSNLKGILSESMTGDQIAYPNDNMIWLPLNYQLNAVYDAALGGLLVTTFKNPNTNTFWTGQDGDGWTPQAGVDAGGVYYGFPTSANNPGNAYAMIFVNTTNPTATLTPAQINKLAYADCAPGGMMGAVCMTGTAAAGYGAPGTMSGYPVSQVITKQ